MEGRRWRKWEVVVAAVVVGLVWLRGGSAKGEGEGEVGVPALFLFGDSLLDTGNNNGLETVAIAESPPYGVDYESNDGSSSQGRFSNGLITSDIIAASLNLPSPPPFVSAGDKIEQGVNFASAGSGILDSTGSYFGEHYSLGTQVRKFGEVKGRLQQQVGTEKAGEIISKSIFYITTGSNDYMVNYYALPPTSSYAAYSPERFRGLLISQLSLQLQSLYNLGARKFAVTAIPNIGCTPYSLRLYGGSEKDEIQCVKFMNDAAMAYNLQFFRLIRRLQDRHPDAHFISNNGYEAALLLYRNPSTYGIVDVTDACCNLGEALQGICLRGFYVCPNASQFFFFDGFHPTSTVHRLTALSYIVGTKPFVFPFNLLKLASLS